MSTVRDTKDSPMMMSSQGAPAAHRGSLSSFQVETMGSSSSSRIALSFLPALADPSRLPVAKSTRGLVTQIGERRKSKRPELEIHARMSLRCAEILQAEYSVSEGFRRMEEDG